MALMARTIGVRHASLSMWDVHATNDKLVALLKAVKVETVAHAIGQARGRGSLHCCSPASAMEQFQA